MHVLVTADTIGGVWTYTRELVTGLAGRGQQVTLVSFGDIPSVAHREWLDALDVHYRPTDFRLEWMQESRRDIEQSGRFLKSVIEEVKPDLLHFNQFCYGSLDVDLPRIVVAHSDVLSWWAAVHEQEPPAHRWMRWYREVVGRGIHEATCIVAPSNWMLQELSAHYGSSERSLVIYNGRDPRLFSPNPQKSDVVLTVGRLWDCAKQAEILTRCGQALPVWIVGSGTHPDNAFRTSTTIEAGQQIELLPPQPESEMRKLYARAAIYAATSRYEPFGLAPLEAALSGCALVANDIASFREIWGDAAIYFDRNDPVSLAKVIACLSADGELRSSWAERAYQRARKRFTADRMVNDYMGLYASLTRAEVAAA